MSMRDYAINDYGFVMTRDILKAICEKYFTGFTEKEYDEDECSFNDVLLDAGIVGCIGDFTGEATVIDDNGNDMYDDHETYDADTIYYVATKNYPTLFNAAYRSMDELVSEFKNKLNKYFPDDFDYRKYICHIVGTYFC